MALGIARQVGIGPLLDPEQTAAAKVPFHAPGSALEHGSTKMRVARPGWHRLDVRLRRGEGDVRARRGYWVRGQTGE